MENVCIMSDSVYEELYDVYLSFNAIQELVSTVQPSKSDFPKGFGTFLCSHVNDFEKVIQSIQLIKKER